MKLLLIRHTSVDVRPGICYGASDVPLRDSFCKEAALVKTRLSGYQIDQAFTSPLSRCKRLAEYCGFPHAIADSRLVERNFGAWEGLEYTRIDDPQLQLWYADFVHTRATEGESFMDVVHRTEGFLEELKETIPPPHTLALFTHGGVITALRFLVEHCSLDNILDLQVPYGTVYPLEL
jgi:phosphoglycerate mutase family protein